MRLRFKPMLIPTVVFLLLGCIGATHTATQSAPVAGPSGQIYHVATSGSNSNMGSEGAPWLTIQHAVEQVQPGDTIVVHAGTYAGARIERSGADAAPITLQVAEGERVIINRPGPNNAHGSNLEIETWEGDGVVAHWVVEGFEVINAPGWGIDCRGDESAHNHHISIRNNVVYDNGLDSDKTGIFAAFTDFVTIEGNVSHNNGEHGVYVNNSSDNFTIRSNRLYGNRAAGIHLNGDASAGGDGVMSDGLVEDNIIFGNGAAGGAAINMDGVSDTLVRNNLLYDNHATGIAIFRQDGGECSSNNRILHNTVSMAADARWALKIAEPDCIGNVLLNNIFHSYHSYRGSINVPASGMTGFVSDYNVLVDRFTTDDGDSVLSLTQWQALGHDAHSLLAEPEELFVDAAAGNFDLRADSPAIDAGQTMPDTPTDIVGQARPVGNGYDIGAYEFQEKGAAGRTYLPIVVVSNQ